MKHDVEIQLVGKHQMGYTMEMEVGDVWHIRHMQERSNNRTKNDICSETYTHAHTVHELTTHTPCTNEYRNNVVKYENKVFYCT